MSAVVQSPSASHWPPRCYQRMTSVEELDNSLTRLRHSALRMPITPPGSPFLPNLPEQQLTVTTLTGQPLSDGATTPTAMLPDSPIIIDRIPPNTPITPGHPSGQLFVTVDPSEASSTTSTLNVIAIDNKIEQAMDLVKTHLTFAVREEVEVLRSTILELESKVQNLEAQNSVLRQFVPSEVKRNLPILYTGPLPRVVEAEDVPTSGPT